MNIPYDYEWPGANLRRWLNAQKNAYSQGLLLVEQVKLLEELQIDWSFEKNYWTWEYKVEQARAFFEERGNLIVGAEYTTEDDFPLGSWIYQLRESYRKEILTEDQIADLDKIGMIWNKNEIEIPAAWLNKYFAYKSYEGFVGTTTVADGVRIGEWAARQRANVDALTEEQIGLLNQAGFIWDLNEYAWDETLEEIKKGNPNTTWIAKQRKRISEGKLPESRIEKLKAAGIDLRTKAERDREIWMKKYQEIIEGKELTDKQKTWIYTQRNRRGRLDEEQQRLLDAL